MVELIAEIGWNHMGDMDLAKKMIEAASESGADYAKFQTFDVNNLKEGPWDDDGRREIYEKAQLSFGQHRELKEYCDSLGITFMSSAFTVEDAKMLAAVSTKCIKIPSIETSNVNLLDYCSRNFDKIFMSTGATKMEEVLEVIKPFNKEKLVLLHCVSSYPCPLDRANLPRIKELKHTFSQTKANSFGYSDHVEGIHASVAALEYDIDVIEKHFTIDKTLPGRDNKFAILPEELTELKYHIEARALANIDRGSNLYQECEMEARTVYSGRWTKNE